MPHLRLPHLPTLAVVCGATLLGWSLGGVASVDGQLAAGSAQPAGHHARLVDDCGPERDAHLDRHEL
jgi:hypothetical protein